MIVDRIENGFAAVEREDGSFFEIPLSELPASVHEGSVLVCNCEGYALDILAERKLRERNSVKTKRLFK